MWGTTCFSFALKSTFGIKRPACTDTNLNEKYYFGVVTSALSRESVSDFDMNFLGYGLDRAIT